MQRLNFNNKRVFLNKMRSAYIFAQGNAVKPVIELFRFKIPGLYGLNAITTLNAAPTLRRETKEKVLKSVYSHLL